MSGYVIALRQQENFAAIPRKLGDCAWRVQRRFRKITLLNPSLSPRFWIKRWTGWRSGE